jgi:hypothetical protein
MSVQALQHFGDFALLPLVARLRQRAQRTQSDLCVWSFHLVLGADSLSAAQTNHLGSSDSGFQTLVLEDVLWCVLGHCHKPATTRMFTDIRNDSYSFHTQRYNTSRAAVASFNPSRAQFEPFY